MMDDLLKDIWPEWAIVRRIGSGSFGTVYEAVRQNQIGEKAAIKVIEIPKNENEAASLRAEGMDQQSTRSYYRDVVDEIINEIRTMESLKGTQNIVSIEDYKLVEHTDRVGWTIYIRMELLTPFLDYQQKVGMTEDDIIKLGLDMCEALQLCAVKNIIHRDIKPENIFVNRFGYYKLGDFGIARTLEATTAGMSAGVGTFAYMAPEVYHTGIYDASADICSLGLVLYRLANYNQLPFCEGGNQQLSPGQRSQMYMKRLCYEEFPPPAGVSAPLASVIMRACAPHKEQRYASAVELKRALENARRGIADDDHPVHVDEKPVEVGYACPSCGYLNSSNAKRCSHCGKKLKHSIVPLLAVLIAILVLLAGAVAWVAFGGDFDFFGAKEKDPTETEMQISENEKIPTLADEDEPSETPVIDETEPAETESAQPTETVSPTKSSTKNTEIAEETSVIASSETYLGSSYTGAMTASSGEVIGNDYENIHFGGYVAYDEEEDILYYANPGDEARLYKRDASGDECIYTGAVMYINIYDGCVYFVDDDPDSSTYLYMYRISPDGTGLKQITNFPVYEPIFADGYVYFGYVTDTSTCKNTVYKMKTDGSDVVQLCAHGFLYGNVVNGTLWFVDSYKNFSAYKISINGGTATCWYSGRMGNLDYDNGYFYFYDRDKNGLFRMDSAGTITTIYSEKVTYLNAYNGKIYFNKYVDDTSGALYEINPDGTGVKKLSDAKPWNLSVGGGKLYYTNIQYYFTQIISVG